MWLRYGQGDGMVEEEGHGKSRSLAWLIGIRYTAACGFCGRFFTRADRTTQVLRTDFQQQGATHLSFPRMPVESRREMKTRRTCHSFHNCCSGLFALPRNVVAFRAEDKKAGNLSVEGVIASYVTLACFCLQCWQPKTSKTNPWTQISTYRQKHRKTA